MPLTEQEKVVIRDILGFLNVEAAQTFALGIPAGVQTQFIIEGAMNRVLESALPRVRQIISIIESIDCQRVENHELLAVRQIGDIQIADDEQENLDKRYRYWRARLANALGAYANPFDQTNGVTSSVGNVRVN